MFIGQHHVSTITIIMPSAGIDSVNMPRSACAGNSRCMFWDKTKGTGGSPPPHLHFPISGALADDHAGVHFLLDASEQHTPRL